MVKTPATPTMDADRLRTLTDAVIAVGAGLDLQDVLQRLVSTAAAFSGARYGALGITGEDGRVLQFVTHGISPQLREQLGGMPSAHGVPGQLLRPDAAALRLPTIGAHPSSVGFPPDHPPMRTFLGVPLRVNGTIFGNLYVADKRAAAGDHALFTAEDEEALLALGAAAGVAVQNARLYAAVRQRQRWSDAVGAAIHAIIAGGQLDTRARLAPIPAIARAAGRCELAVLAVRQSDGSWPIRYADATPGTDATTPIGRELPDARPLRPVSGTVAELGPDDLEWLPGDWAFGLLVPVEGTGSAPEEALVLAFRRAPEPALGRADRDSELAFGQRLGLALQVAQAQADSAALTLLRDRDRIARDLHDLVIQRLFAIGLSLQAAGVAARVPEVASRLSRAVDDIDETIKDVRRTIFELHATTPRSDLRARIDEVLTEIGDGLPADVAVHTGGGLDDVRPELAAELLAVLREALTNVVRHARADTVTVYVTAGGDLELEVVDDGVGVPDVVHPGQGLPNLQERAEARGGSCDLTRAPEGGSVLRWAVPLAPPRREPLPPPR